MAEPQPGDLLAVMTAGAYGAVQAGTYNTRALGAGSPCSGRTNGRWCGRAWRSTQLIALDRLPPWLERT